MARRTERLEIRLTPREKADLREQADTESMTITELVVDRCLRHLGYIDPPECDYCEHPVDRVDTHGWCKDCDELTPLNVTVAQIGGCSLCGEKEVVESALLPLLCKECDEREAQKIRDGGGA